MAQSGKDKPPLDGSGFIVAALLAPGIALALFYVGMGLTESFVGAGGLGRLVGNFLLLLLIASFWGAVPSLIFGGLVLSVIQRMPWRVKSTPLVFMAGGVLAAGLYVLTGFGTAMLSPGVTMFFAPWATDLGAPGANRQEWWLVSSLLLSGAAAGLIYAPFAKRG